MPTLVASALALVWPIFAEPSLFGGDTRAQLQALAMETADILRLEAEGRVTHLYAEITLHQVLDDVESIAAHLPESDRNLGRLTLEMRTALLARDAASLAALGGQFDEARLPH